MFLRFLHKIPSIRLLLPYLLGVFFLSCHLVAAFSLFAFGFWGLILFGYIENKMLNSWAGRWIPGICFTCLWISIGACSSEYEQRATSFPLCCNKKIIALVKIETTPVEKPKSWQFSVQVKHTNSEEWNGKRLQVYIAKSEKAEGLQIGDVLMAYMKPQNLEATNELKAFDYAGWLRKKGICATAYISSVSWKLYSRASHHDFVAEAERIRSKLLNRFKKANISGDEFSLVSALTLGGTNQLTSVTKKQFSVSGISHILSVSGLHVGAIYAVLDFLLSFFNRFKRLKILKQILIVLLLWCYAFVTGLSPSVIRSTLMFSLLILGRCFHRKTQTVNTVMCSAFLLLLWKPSFLFDLSFELSYCAVISIVLAHARMKELLDPSTKAIRYLWEMICLSTVAQLGTSPLTIYYFHQFPNYFLLNNLVAVPASALIIYQAVALLLLFDIPVLGDILSWSLNECLHLFQKFVEIMSDLPFALTQNIEIEIYQVLALYALMGALFIWFFIKRKSWIFAVLFSILFLQGLSLNAFLKSQRRSDICGMYVNSYICKNEIHDYKNYCRRSDRKCKTHFKAIKCCGYYIPPRTRWRRIGIKPCNG